MTSKDWVTALLPVLTLLIGLAAAPLTETLREERQRRRDREDARHRFQAETLLELQEVLHRYVRFCGAPMWRM